MQTVFNTILMKQAQNCIIIFKAIANVLKTEGFERRRQLETHEFFTLYMYMSMHCPIETKFQPFRLD